MMPRSRMTQTLPRKARTAAAGFTLLEILVVIIIVGIIISVATIAVGTLGRDREMQDQAERLWAVLEQAKEETSLQGFDVGVRIGTSSYDFVRFDARTQSWLPVTEDDLFAARALPEGLRLRLWLEGRETVLSENLDTPSPADDAKESEDKSKDSGLSTAETAEERRRRERPPQVMILSSGDVNSFEVHFERDGGDSRWRVFSGSDNTVTAEQMRDDV